MPVKEEKHITDWNNPKDRLRYEKSRMPSTSVCPLSNKDGICAPSLTTSRDDKGTIEPFSCWSQWYTTCDTYMSTYGGLRPDTDNKEIYD